MPYCEVCGAMIYPVSGNPHRCKKPKRKIKKFDAEERKRLGLDEMPEHRYGEQCGRDPHLHEEPPIDFDPRGKNR